METMGRTKRPRRSFSKKQFKAEVVDLVRQTGNTPASVARDLDLTETAVRAWVRQAEVDDGGREGPTSTKREDAAAPSDGALDPGDGINGGGRAHRHAGRRATKRSGAERLHRV